MKILIDRLAFRNALQRVEMGIDRKPTNPVYGGILIEAANDSVVLMTNDLDMAVRYQVDFVQVDQPGWAVIPGRELVDIIKDLESDTVILALQEKGQIEVQSGEDVCTLVTFESSASDTAAAHSESFPLVPTLDGEADIVMDKGDFLVMVNSTRFATSRVQDTRFATEGILLELAEGQATMVGTDGRRLACIKRPTTGGKGSKSRSVLLPKVLDQIYRFGQDEEGNEIQVWFLGNLVGFKLGNLESFGRVLTGEYPNYTNVIPQGGKHVLNAHRESFTKKLRLASHLTQDSAAVVRLAMSSNNLEIASEHEGRGRASANFEVDYAGDGLKTSFNPSFLLDGLKAAHSEQIELQIDDPSRPAKFKLGDDYTYVVMPLSALV
ncbi:MAG: DNA polymerase III subunit beta [Planctomycetota bacterium]|jgi:DNA polymerase-3 subunit beta|nr:DNA polymerase III subunit beta [Planctomycetota bacterium]